MAAGETANGATQYRVARPGRPKQVWGGLLMASSPIAFVVFVVIGALTVNPCGAFGDACDDYGEATAFGTTMFAFALACPLVFIGGAVLLIVGSMQNRN